LTIVKTSIARKEERRGRDVRKTVQCDAVAERGDVVVRYSPMHDQILPHIRRDIVENRWKSGERLSEPLLCKEFGVSRTPLRQALKTLEAEGLVRLIPHVGAVVTDPGAAEIRERMEILMGLEQLAATRVAQAGKPDVLREIRRIHREMRDAAGTADARRYYALNDLFHLTIVYGTGNQSLIDLHEKVMWHVRRERHRANFAERMTSHNADSHKELVRAIMEQQPEAAGVAMRRHLEDVTELMLAHWEAQAATSKSSARMQKPKQGRGPGIEPARR
jgi:DNA-binding GntR family transcriptional regulator